MFCIKILFSTKYGPYVETLFELIFLLCIYIIYVILFYDSIWVSTSWHFNIFVYLVITDGNNICFTASCSEALPSNPTDASSNDLKGYTIVGKIKIYTCITGYEYNTNSGSQGKKNCVLIELCQFTDDDFWFSADKRDKSNLYKFSEWCSKMDFRLFSSNILHK